jgi:acyl carrier protein
MAAEEVFSIELPDDECGSVITVGDFYRLVLSKLSLPYIPLDPDQIPGRDRSKDKYPGLAPWTSLDVGATLKGIILDQLQVDIEEITENATFQDDLRCD